MAATGTPTAKLGPDERRAAIEALKSTELDILVVGGGIVGAGAALDSVTRGLTTGIVEARDWASGTSSRSSKLVHGGIRYLEQLDFRLVREALIERGLLLQRIAPHLVKPVRFLYPLKKRVIERFYIGAGMMLYDIFSYSGGRPPGVPHHRHLSKKQVRELLPSLAPDALIGGLTYYDAQVDDAKYVSTLVRTAAAYGAHAASRLNVVEFLRQGERVVGVTVHDLETDVPRDRFHGKSGLILRTEKSVLFVIPWGRHWLIGTTDTDWNLDKAHPAATAADIDYLLEHVNSVLSVPLTREDVEGVYAGLRPLLAGESDQTSKLSREHLVAHALPGLVVIAGGKWTTYRVMAKDAVDEAVQAMDGRISASVTQDIALVGGEGYKAAWNRRARMAEESGLELAQVEHLLNRYGSLTGEVLELLASRPELAEPLPGADDYLQVEALYAATHEGALHLDDLLARRTRISIESWDRGVSAAPVAARLMADALGWDSARVDREVSTYLERVAAERASQEQPDDASADRVRLEAPDIVSTD